MKVSDFRPLPVLAELIGGMGMSSVTVFYGGVPTSEMPENYIALMQNGSIRPKTIKLSYAEGFIMITVNVKLLANGTTNTTREDLILDRFGKLFENNKTVEYDGYKFSLDTSNLGSGSRGISSGYSTKIINLQVKIY